jgi:hypothetical protein
VKRAAAAALLVACSACSQGLLFAQDRRVEIVSPVDDAEVTLPVTVRWSVDEGSDIAAFGVYVDLEPQPPGETFDWFARGDQTCEQTPGCPDRAYFEQRGAYFTKAHELTIPDLLPLAGVDIEDGEKDRHDVTIVVLDAEGRRITEAFWSENFEIVHPELNT